MRLSYLLELVAALAVGLGFATWRERLGPQLPSGFQRVMSFYDREEFTWSVLIGVAVAGLLGLVVESLRKRGPATWGFGRWMWSLMGLAVLVGEATTIGY